jgi:hypothetical protein
LVATGTRCTKINGAARNVVKICEKTMRGGRNPHRAMLRREKAAMPARYFFGSVTR